jgi:uncharacterized protein DUF3303
VTAGRSPAEDPNGRCPVLFCVTWEFIDTSETGVQRSLEVFGRWEPPPGADFKAFYGYADGTGGVAIIEVDSVATLARTTAPWVPWLRFTVKPILPIEESAGIGGEGAAFRASVG